MLKMYIYLTLIIINTINYCESKRSLFSLNVFEENASIVGELKVQAVNLNGKINVTSTNRTEYTVNAIMSEPLYTEFNAKLNINADVKSSRQETESNGKQEVTAYDLRGLIKCFAINGTLHLNSKTWLQFDNFEQYKVHSDSILSHSSGLEFKYNLQFVKQLNCPQLTLNHNLTSNIDNLIDFASNVSDQCLSDEEYPPFVRRINISLSSGVWHTLNTNLKQIFTFHHRNGWESMNLTHPFGDIHVTADWNSGNEYTHFKKATFTSKVDQLIPNFTIEYLNDHSKPIRLMLTIQNRHSKSNHWIDTASLKDRTEDFCNA